MQRNEFFTILEFVRDIGYLHYTIREPVQFECERVMVCEPPTYGVRGIELIYRVPAWYVYHLLSGEIEKFGRTEPQFYNTDTVFICSEGKNTEVETFLGSLHYA